MKHAHSFRVKKSLADFDGSLESTRQVRRMAETLYRQIENTKEEIREARKSFVAMKGKKTFGLRAD